MFAARGQMDVPILVISNTSGIVLRTWDQPYDLVPIELTGNDLAVFAGNHRRDIAGFHGAALNDGEMDVMVLKANTIRAWVGGNTPEVMAGVTWTSSGLPTDVRHNLIMVVEACGIGRDDIDPMVLGHEVGHYLINSPYHYQASWNLMYDQPGTQEAPDGPKRLTANDVDPSLGQIYQSRNSDEVSPRSVQIPEKRR